MYNPEHLYVHPYNSNGTPTSASDVIYNNTHSGLEADNVQSAIDELSATKQNQLIAGENITIVGNRISSTAHVTATYDSTEENVTLA